MNYKKNFLLTTPLKIGFKKPLKKNFYLLGEWCNLISLNNNLIFKVQRHHWTNFKKLKKDSVFIEKTYEKFLDNIYKELNKLHKKKKDKNYWRIIIGPWLSFYITTMYERWETLRIFFENNNKKFEIISNNKDNKCLINFNTIDFLTKAQSDHLWNHENYLRIIKFKYQNKVFETKYKFSEGQKRKICKKLKTRSFFSKIFYLIDYFLSLIALKYNNLILESFYFSKIDLIYLHLKLRLIPSFYKKTFSDLKFLNFNKLDKNKRLLICQKINFSKGSFFDYLIYSIRQDFPTCYVEKFQDFDNSIKGYISKKKKIFTMVSHFFNERFKFWVAEMVSKGSSLHIVHHGGSLPPKLSLFLNHNQKISKKILSWFNFKSKDFTQISPVQLKKYKFLKQNVETKCLILSCETNRYPVRCQSWPYAEQYKLWFKEVCTLVENFKKDIYDNVTYRCISSENGYETIKQFEKKFKGLESTNTESSTLKEELTKTKIAICTYPDTPIADCITSNVPTIIIFSKKLYRLNDNTKKLIKNLEKNNIFFEDPILASKHINDIWENPQKWWQSKEIQSCVNQLRKKAFNLKDNWREEWSNYLKKEINKI